MKTLQALFIVIALSITSTIFSQFKFTVSGYESEKDELQKQMSSITEKLLKNYKS
jgi:uncharacterized membrane protein